MTTNLNIISYNCQSLNLNAAIIQDLLKSCDILCLQETLIDDNNRLNLENLSNDFMTAYIPAQRKPGCFVGRSSGGLAILWKKMDVLCCTPLLFDRRIIGLSIKLPDDNNILILNAYFPCDYGNLECALDYKSTLANLGNILESENFQEVIITGDLNADPNKGRFYNEILKFAAENSLNIFDVENLPSDSYTYISSNFSCSSSWLDHLLCSNSDFISNVSILYGITFFDHIPLRFTVNLPLQFVVTNSVVQAPQIDSCWINWDSVGDRDKLVYAQVLDELCTNVPQDVFLCQSTMCTNENHKKLLENLYGDLLECISVASLHLPSGSMNSCQKDRRVVGWNFHCRELYRIAREKYMEWHSNGRIRMGSLFEEMKTSRKAFKNALKYCRNNEAKIKKEIILRKFGLKNKSAFWKEISKVNGKNSKKFVSIDGNSDAGEIVSIFDQKYKDILDDPRCQTPPSVENMIRVPQANALPLITMNNLDQAIYELNVGKGWDGIHAYHFKFVGKNFRGIFCKFLNKLLDHAFVPRSMIFGEIRPVIKNNSLSKNDSNNYRPVMNSSMSLKILEYCIQPTMMKSLRLNSRQFGFRKDTGCLQAIALVKETIKKYNAEGSCVHAALVDCSKAFDRINIKILFGKLLASDLDIRIIVIIMCTYNNTFVNTVFNGAKSAPWLVGNGVRQGGILSPLLFSFYINETLDIISEMSAGCSISGYKTNLTCYADDLIFLAPSANGLQLILDKLGTLFSALSLFVNPDKSNYIIFKPRNFRFDGSPNITLKGTMIPRVNSCKYLGVIISENGDLADDVDRVLNAFYRQFNGMFSKFNFTNREVLSFLFKTFTSSFYGIDAWIENLKKFQLDRISVAFHKAVKRIGGFNVWDSNHEACEAIGVLLFKHLLSKRLVCFWHNLFKCNSPCLVNLKYYFQYKSHFFNSIKSHFMNFYQVDIACNPLCAIISRIYFVQRNEPRSFYAHSLSVD